MKKVIKALALGIAAGLMVFAVTGCGTQNTSSTPQTSSTPVVSSAPTAPTAPAADERYVNIEITMEDGGVMKLELDREAAPATVENFVTLVNDGFYDGLTFHRIIEGFMIQGGDPEGTGMGGSTENVVGEFSSNGWENPISHTRGVISMARSQSPDSASSQFFIVHADSVFLDGEYAAFGKLTEGFDVLDKLAGVETGTNDMPIEPVIIKTIRVL